MERVVRGRVDYETVKFKVRWDEVDIESSGGGNDSQAWTAAECELSKISDSNHLELE